MEPRKILARFAYFKKKKKFTKKIHNKQFSLVFHTTELFFDYKHFKKFGLVRSMKKTNYNDHFVYYKSSLGTNKYIAIISVADCLVLEVTDKYINLKTISRDMVFEGYTISTDEIFNLSLEHQVPEICRTEYVENLRSIMKRKPKGTYYFCSEKEMLCQEGM